MQAEELGYLRDLMQEKCIRKGDYILSSGLPAKYYYDGKNVTLRPSAAERLGPILLELVRSAGAEAVGGMAVGADPIAQTIALASLHDGGPEIPAFIVRPEPKGHGTKEQTSSSYTDDGTPLLSPGRRVAIVDDVITTGGSVKGAMKAAEEQGCEIAIVIALVERHESGGKALKDAGYNFRRLFYTTESGDLFIDEQLPQRSPVLSGRGV